MTYTIVQERNSDVWLEVTAIEMNSQSQLSHVFYFHAWSLAMASASKSARDNAQEALSEFVMLSKGLLSRIVDVSEEREVMPGNSPEDLMRHLIQADKRLQGAVHCCKYFLRLNKY